MDRKNERKNEGKWTETIPCFVEGYAVFKSPETAEGFCEERVVAFRKMEFKDLVFLEPLVGCSDTGVDTVEDISNFSHWHWGPKDEIKI